MLKKLKLDKNTSKVYCIDTDGNYYAEFDLGFNCWAPHTPIKNGTYPISHENADAMDYGNGKNVDDNPAFGTFWIALDRTTGKGLHGYDKKTNRSLTSGTNGCVRAENEDGEQICRAIDEALQYQKAENAEFGIDQEPYIMAEVVGDVDDSQFILGGGGEQ